MRSMSHIKLWKMVTFIMRKLVKLSNLLWFDKKNCWRFTYDVIRPFKRLWSADWPNFWTVTRLKTATLFSWCYWQKTNLSVNLEGKCTGFKSAFIFFSVYQCRCSWCIWMGLPSWKWPSTFQGRIFVTEGTQLQSQVEMGRCLWGILIKYLGAFL